MAESKTVPNIPEFKKETVSELGKLMKEKGTILVASIKNIPGNQFQEISKKLRGKAIVKVPKKSLIFRAIEGLKNEDLNKIKENIDDSFALLFSDIDAFELAGILLRNKTPAKAKPGQIAPEDIEIEAGPTELLPGPAISELGAVGLKVQVEGGKLSIKENKVIVKKGEEISQKAADIMSKLDIKPFSIGFVPLCGLDVKNKVFYQEIVIDTEGTLANLKYAYGKALPFAVEIGYISNDTVKVMIMKAGSQAKRINRIITGEPEEVVPETGVEEVKEESKDAQESTSEKKEEPKADAGAGLSALFG